METFDANAAVKKLICPKVDFALDDFISGLVWIPLSASEIYLIASSSSGSIIVYNIVKNQMQWTVDHAHKGDVLALVRCGGHRFATSGQDGKIKIWDVSSPKEVLHTIDCGKNWIEHVVYSQELERLVASVGPILRVWSMKQGEIGKLLKEFPPRSSTISCLRLNSRKNILYSSSYGEVFATDIETLEHDSNFKVTYLMQINFFSPIVY